LCVEGKFGWKLATITAFKLTAIYKLMVAGSI